MNSYQLADKQCGFEPYSFLWDISHKVISVKKPLDDFKRFGRESLDFTMDETSVIEKMPAYVPNGEGVYKLTDLVEYWQYQVCNMLCQDIEGQAEGRLVKIAVCEQLEQENFYSSCFPLILWRLITEDIFNKVVGTVWVKYER